MTGNNYQHYAARTINPKLNKSEQEHHALFGMSSEIGELQGLYQKELQGHEFDPEHAKKELGDLMWFIAEYCTAKNWKLDDVMRINIDKLIDRYPEGFDSALSINRKEGDI